MKKKGRLEKNESMHYVIEIAEWNQPYSFSISFDLKPLPGLPDSGPFYENTDINIAGRLLSPKKLDGRAIEIRIIGHRDIVRMVEHPEDYSEKPKGIGSLTVRGKRSEGLCFVPHDALHTLCLLLQAGKIKFLVFTGQPLYRGNAEVTAIHLEKEYKHEDWN